MSEFRIEITEIGDICLNIFCLECENNFSTELDLIQQITQNLPYSTTSNSYCTVCEASYEYDIIIDSNNLQVKFNNNSIEGSLKYSTVVNLEDYKTPSIKKSKQFYFTQIKSFQKLLNIKSEEYLVEQSLYRLVFTGIITALETYLNEIYIITVFYSESTIEKFVKEYEPYKKERFSLNEIFQKYNSLKIRIKEDLDSFLYHNISKLIPIFDIYDFKLKNFHEINTIAKHIKKRHNLVHRSGLDDEDNFCEVSKTEVITLITDVNLLVEYIDLKLETRCFLSELENDLAF